MVQTLHADVHHAHASLARLSSVRAAPIAAASDTSAQHLLDQARARPDDPDTRGRQLMLDALGVTVHVTDYIPLPRLRRHRLPAEPARPRAALPPGCPTCHRMQTIPEVAVRITAPQALRALTALPPNSSAAAG